MSIAGGYYKAVEAAARCGCDCVQLFTKNNNQWRAKPITKDDIDRFQHTLARLKITHPIAHDSYLINLGSPDPELWKKSVDALVVEIERSSCLGIHYVVTHPGAYTTSSESAGLKKIIRGLNEIDRQTGCLNAACLLETTAGQGTSLGWKFEHLATLLDGVRNPDRLGICFDTCHVFAAGYPLGSESEYRATMRTFNRILGTKRIKAFHLNDSKTEFGSHVDRHAKIGAGSLGLEPFRHLLNDRRFRRVPMYLETPKGTEDSRGSKDGEELDVINLRTLRSLVEKRS